MGPSPRRATWTTPGKKLGIGPRWGRSGSTACERGRHTWGKTSPDPETTYRNTRAESRRREDRGRSRRTKGRRSPGNVTPPPTPFLSFLPNTTPTTETNQGTIFPVYFHSVPSVVSTGPDKSRPDNVYETSLPSDAHRTLSSGPDPRLTWSSTMRTGWDGRDPDKRIDSLPLSVRTGLTTLSMLLDQTIYYL